MSRAVIGSAFHGILFFLSLSVFATASLAGPSPEAASGTIVLEEKTFARWPDPVVMDVGMFPSLLGKKIEHLRLYAYRSGALGPIPFQVDEKDAEGGLILTEGQKANPEAANGLLDKGEELVFMARDSGDRLSPGGLPPDVALSEELTLKDPLTGGKGWVYVLYDPSGALPLSEEDYIVYDPVYPCDPFPNCLLHRSAYYEVRHYPQAPYYPPEAYANTGFAHHYISLSPKAGGTGIDFWDRFKVRVTMAFFFGAIKLRVDENAITFYENGYKDGPVRVIRNDKVIITLPLGIKAPGAATNVIWYDTIVNVPLIIDIPFNPGYLYTYLQISIGEDHSKEAVGMEVYNSNNTTGVLVDGRMADEAEKHWNSDRDEWRLITGPQGTLMNRSIWDQRYLEQMKKVTVEYFDDAEEDDPPEDVPGMYGMIRQTNRVEGIKKDRYYSYLEWYYPPSFLFSGPDKTYRVGDEKPYLDISDAPLRVQAGGRSMESHYFGQMPPMADEASPGKDASSTEKDWEPVEEVLHGGR